MSKKHNFKDGNGRKQCLFYGDHTAKSNNKLKLFYKNK